MKNKHQKIPAFTMVDVLTGMIIMSIIISMVFYVFTALNQQVYEYGNSRNQVNTYLLLRSDLKHQFESQEMNLTGTPGGFLAQGSEVKIAYKKEGSFLLRETNDLVDTLTENLSDMEVSFLEDGEGKLTDLVKALQLEITFGNQNLVCRFYKDYSRVGEINQKLLNGL